MSNKFASAVAFLLGIFFLYAGLKLSDMGSTGASLIAVLVMAFMFTASTFCYAQDYKPTAQ